MVALRPKQVFYYKIALAVVSIVALGRGVEGAYCSDENEALSLVLPCVTSGSVQVHPSKPCCSGMKRLVSHLTLSCMCEVLISVGGTTTPVLVQNYIKRCALAVPPKFECK